jgi:iron(III) transport system ATP-binding protein
VRITVRGVTKRFGPLAAVSAVSLEIRDGELFTLLGPSGCGKTTLLRLIAGFYRADEGDILFDEQRVNDVPPEERRIGMVFQNYALWPHMTVEENVSYGLKLRKINEKEKADRVKEILRKVGLQNLEKRYPGQLSGGQQQRVALARALVLNPGILLLDEPLSNLDAKIRIQVRAEIRKLQKEFGITAVYVTHDQEEALALSDRIAVFSQGAVLQVGPPKELYERPATRFVADFIGLNNLIEGNVLADTSDFLRVQTAFGSLRGIARAQFEPGERCVVCVRPENGHVNGPVAADGNLLRGKVTFSAYLGNRLIYDVDVGNGVLFKADVSDPWHHDRLPAGSEVSVAFSAASTLVIPAD